MKLTITSTPEDAGIPVRKMLPGQFAVIVSVPDSTSSLPSGVGVGEIIHYSVAGWVGLSDSRYWPSDYMSTCKHDFPQGQRSYIPDFRVKILPAGTTLVVSE